MRPTSEQKRRRAETARRRYKQRRLVALKEHVPNLPMDALERTGLRQLSACTRRCGAKQSTLGAFIAGDISSRFWEKELSLSVWAETATTSEVIPSTLAQHAEAKGTTGPGA